MSFKKHKDKLELQLHVVAEINERAILSLDAPVLRVAAADTVFPFSEAESVWLPNVKDIIETATKVLKF